MIKRYPLHTFILTVLTLALVFQPGKMELGWLIFLVVIFGAGWGALIYKIIKPGRNENKHGNNFKRLDRNVYLQHCFCKHR